MYSQTYYEDGLLILKIPRCVAEDTYTFSFSLNAAGTGAYIRAYVDSRIHWNHFLQKPKRRNRLVPEFHYVPWLRATYDDCCKSMGVAAVRNING